MSVEKMNYYKEQKSHRKENLAKEKRRKKATRAAWTAVGVVVAGALCCAIGLTGYNTYRANQLAKPDYSVSSQVIEDLTGVLNLDEDIDLEEGEESGGEAEETEEAAETEEAVAGETAAE